MNTTPNKKFAIRDGGPTTMELAQTRLRAADDGVVRPWDLVTLMDVTLGVLVGYTLNAADEPLPEYMRHGFDDDALFADQPDDLTLSIPDASVLSDDVLVSLPIRDHVHVVRREMGEGLQPVHRAAVALLGGTTSRYPMSIDALVTRLYATWVETHHYSLYEHTFNSGCETHFQPVATYRQALVSVGDERAHHDFGPYCCDIAQMQDLTTRPAVAMVGVA